MLSTLRIPGIPRLSPAMSLSLALSAVVALCAFSAHAAAGERANSAQAVAAERANSAQPLAGGRVDTPAPALETGIRESVRAGERIDLKWTGIDASIEELEIQLSVDGGRHFTLRVTPELDARAGHFVWRVPNLATADARLRVRFNRGGREIEGSTSAAFRIMPRADDAPEYAQIHEGAWWMGTRDPEAAPASSALASPEPSLCAAGPASAPAIQARGMSLPRVVRSTTSSDVTVASAPPSAASRETTAPRVIARRN
jgi:hypothetical protein